MISIDRLYSLSDAFALGLEATGYASKMKELFNIVE